MTTEFPNIYMGIVYDSLRIMGIPYNEFLINLKPVCGYSGLIQGPAFTTFGEVVEGKVTEEEYQKLDNIRLEMYNPEKFVNNPIVFLQSNDEKVAHSGDLTSLIYQKLGAVGFVTDGIVRDIDVIDKTGFPIFCNEQNPIDAWLYWALTKYQITVTIQGVEINPGDFTFASRDGVIIVKRQLFHRFKKIAIEQLERENMIRNIINKQENTFNYTKLVEEFGRW